MRLRWDFQPDQWQQIINHCPGATIFHTPAWAQAAAEAGLGTLAPLTAQWPDGRAAILPIIVRPIWKGLAQAAQVGINGGYGGVLANGPLSAEETATLFEALRRRFPDCSGSSNPFGDEAVPGDGFTLQPAAPTRALTLAPLDTLRRAYNENRLRTVKRYQKQGVTVRFVERPDAADRREFYRLYRIEVEAWQSAGRSLHLVQHEGWFEALFRLAGNRLHLAFATVDGEVAGAYVFGVQGRIATELYVAWDRRFKASEASTALKEAALAQAWDLGLAVMDYMPSGALAGVEHYKASFGAVARPIQAYSHQSWFTKTLMALRPSRLSAGRPATPVGTPIRQGETG